MRRPRSRRWPTGALRTVRSSWCWCAATTTTAPAIRRRTLGFRVVDEPLLEDGFALCHHPRPIAGKYVLAGHLHPCVGVGRRGWDHLRLPCFWLGDQVGVLPAFGAFTGMHAVRPAALDRLFAVADGLVASMPVAGERFAA